MRRILIEAKRPLIQIDFKEFIDYKWVLSMLVFRDIKLRYKQTVLGILWVILQPLLTALFFAVVFGRILSFRSGEIPYLLFAFCGLVPWLTFSQSLQRGTTSLINDHRLISKVYFPRIFIPLSASLGVGIDYLLSLGILGILIPLYGLPFSKHLISLPLLTLLLFGFSSGMNFIVSSLCVYYRDFKHMIPFVSQLWMYATPLFYSMELIPEKYCGIYSLNPMVGIVELFRWMFFDLPIFPIYSGLISLIWTLILFFAGAVMFRRIEPSFADVI